MNGLKEKSNAWTNYVNKNENLEICENVKFQK